MSAPERIEFLYWEDCPSHPEALALLRTILAERDIATEIEIRAVESHEDAGRLRFPGSPTIRIDGRDVDPTGDAADSTLSCRVYWLADGRVSPVPSRAQIEEALA